MTAYTKIDPVVDYLKTKKLLYAIVDQANVRNKHEKLFNKVYDLTYSFISRLSASTVTGDVQYFDNIDHAMNYSDGYDIVLIQSVGNFINHNSFFEHLNTYCKTNPNFFLIAFTLDWDPQIGQGWIECHNQMMVINVHTWKQLDSPKYGNWEDVTEELPNYIRSEENFHDKYTPYWIKGTEGTSLKLRSKQGWSFIKTALSNGIRIDNFTSEMRDCRLYIYPDFESDKLYTSIINQDSADLTNPNQKKFIDKFTRPEKTLWIYNSERYNFGTDMSSCDVYFGTAAGFKYLDVLNYNLNMKFVFYDYNMPSLNWIKHLKENWDGNNLPAFLQSQPKETRRLYKFINKDIEYNQELMFKDFGSEENFKNLWDKFKKSDAVFVQGSLFNTTWLKSLLTHYLANKPFFYYSNIFATDFISMMFSLEEIDNKYKEFLDTIYQVYPNALTNGCDPKGIWYID
jgi:hypothetical protein